MPNLLFSSSDFEVVLILVVKSDSNRLNLRGQSEDATSYKVRIEHTPKPRRPGVACLRAWDADWTFSCSCPSYARSAPTMCKYIGACLIVHFYQHKVHNVHIVHIAQSRTGSFKLKNTSVPLRSPTFVFAKNKHWKLSFDPKIVIGWYSLQFSPATALHWHCLDWCLYMFLFVKTINV